MSEPRTTFKTEWGWIELAASDNGITAIVLPPSARTGEKNGHIPADDSNSSDAAASMLDQAEQQVIEYLDGKRRDFSVPVDMSQGTPFQRRVWRAILRIPYGRVRSYQWVAEKVGGKQYARAVGMALGSNPVPIIVPCHRVIAHDGSLGGFGCGLPMKRRLLRLEGTLP
jgi:methylated-DNA-[protein]-cysteine S-methyltransferase